MCSTPEGNTKYESTNHHSTSSSIPIHNITIFVAQNMTILNSKINIYFCCLCSIRGRSLYQFPQLHEQQFLKEHGQTPSDFSE